MALKINKASNISLFHHNRVFSYYLLKNAILTRTTTENNILGRVKVNCRFWGRKWGRSEKIAGIQVRKISANSRNSMLVFFEAAERKYKKWRRRNVAFFLYYCWVFSFGFVVQLKDNLSFKLCFILTFSLIQFIFFSL